MLSIPALPLTILVIAVIDPESNVIVGLLLARTVQSALARTIRAQVLEIGEREYVEAARAMNGTFQNPV